MKTFITILLLLLLIGCKEDVSATYSITVYGVNNCGVTSNLRTKLTNENLSFTYRDINNSQYYNEMFNVVYEFKLVVKASDGKDSVSLPIVLVIVDGVRYGFMRPSIETIKALVDLTSALLIYNSTRDLIGIQGARFIDIYDMSGIRLLHSDNNYINIQSLVSGVYVMVINRRTTLKFLKI